MAWHTMATTTTTTTKTLRLTLHRNVNLNSSSSRPITTFTTRLFKLPQPPPTPSPHHNTLTTFESHSLRTSLSPTTTYYTGTHYEYTVQNNLRPSAFALHRTGGRDDAGIDLAGTWHLPERAHPLRVIVQCKALKAKLGPNLVRELEGTFHQAPAGWRGEKAGVLVSPREATKGVREALARSTYPLVWILMEKGGVIRQALWNARAEGLGLGGLGVEVRYGESCSEGEGESEDVEEGEEGLSDKRIVFTWEGEQVEGMDSIERKMEELSDQWVRLWGRRDRERVLEAVERLFPDEMPSLATGVCCSLSDEQRAEVLRAVDQTGESE